MANLTWNPINPNFGDVNSLVASSNKGLSDVANIFGQPYKIWMDDLQAQRKEAIQQQQFDAEMKMKEQQFEANRLLDLDRIGIQRDQYLLEKQKYDETKAIRANTAKFWNDYAAKENEYKAKVAQREQERAKASEQFGLGEQDILSRDQRLQNLSDQSVLLKARIDNSTVGQHDAAAIQRQINKERLLQSVREGAIKGEKEYGQRMFDDHMTYTANPDTDEVYPKRSFLSTREEVYLQHVLNIRKM